jgi:hypothetical protein
MQNNMGVQRTQRTRPENTRGHIGIWTSIRDEKEGGCPRFSRFFDLLRKVVNFRYRIRRFSPIASGYNIESHSRASVRHFHAPGCAPAGGSRLLRHCWRDGEDCGCACGGDGHLAGHELVGGNIESIEIAGDRDSVFAGF